MRLVRAIIAGSVLRALTPSQFARVFLPLDFSASIFFLCAVVVHSVLENQSEMYKY